MKKSILTQAKIELVKNWKASGLITDVRVLRSFRKVKRELFVLPQYQEQAYKDAALPLFAGQTISQPSTVMAMLQALRVQPKANVLEIGTGSGYQAALLTTLVGRQGSVYTIERIKKLVTFAQRNLHRARVKNVHVIHGDGSKGYTPQAPYDRIIVGAAAPRIPDSLLAQLKIGGILVIPVGPLHEQELLRITKLQSGYHTEHLGWYVFVPLRGMHGYPIA